MSSYNLRAHGGSANLVGLKGEVEHSNLFVQNTKAGKIENVHSAHLNNLIVNTTGTRGEQLVHHGVLSSTKQGISDMNVPELHKQHHKGKTQGKTIGQVPYAGKNY